MNFAQIYTNDFETVRRLGYLQCPVYGTIRKLRLQPSREPKLEKSGKHFYAGSAPLNLQLYVMSIVKRLVARGSCIENCSIVILGYEAILRTKFGHDNSISAKNCTKRFHYI